ncbi:hypothetical protein J7L27_00935 [Candidatus Bathyarchaeota archaeon]|nr:hypothetical protein [Candidatus Bathyarchaeota archaeon]
MSKIDDVVAKAHHSYPCTASMEIDGEIGDATLHKSRLHNSKPKKRYSKSIKRKC